MILRRLAAIAGLDDLARPSRAPREPHSAGLAIGDAAPMTDVKMKNVDGKEVTIAGVKGTKGTLVVFSCNHCPWAKAWESRIVELGNAYPKRGVGVIVINPNDPSAYEEDAYPAMQQRARQRGMKYPYAVDATSDLARAYGATRTPRPSSSMRRGASSITEPSMTTPMSPTRSSTATCATPSTRSSPATRWR